MRNIKHERKQYFIFAGGYLIMNFIISAIFILLLAGTHFAEENSFPRFDENHMLPGSWARHALDTSLDWAPQSRLANFFVGGANCHAAHHLFPGICHIHYPEISRIIGAALAFPGIEYNQTTLPKMVKSQFRFLKKPDAAKGIACWNCLSIIPGEQQTHSI